jgi:hypothetical protein
VPIGAFSADRLADALMQMKSPAMRARAVEVGERVRAERGADGAVEAMHRHLEKRGRRPS